MDIVIINVPTSAAGHTVQYLLVISPLPRLSVLLLDPCLLCPPHSPLFCGPFAVAHILAHLPPPTFFVELFFALALPIYR
jgi:hypothetical protein